MNAVLSQPVGHSRRVTMAGEAEERRAAQDFAAGRDQEFVEPLAIRPVATRSTSASATLAL